MKKIEELNTLVFIVDTRASKRHIKDAIASMYDVTAQKVTQGWGRQPCKFACISCFHMIRSSFFRNAFLPDLGIFLVTQ